MKICVYSICKNEEKFAHRWLACAEEADVIYINDTGSTDNTIEILKSHPKVNLIQGKFSGENFRFDYAWNELLDTIPQDVDLCVRLDFDQFLSPGWRNVLEDFSSDFLKECKSNKEILVINSCLITIKKNILDSDKVNAGTFKSYFQSIPLAFGPAGTVYYVNAVHEKLYFGEEDCFSKRIPLEKLCIIHTPESELDEEKKREKIRRYFELSLKGFKTCSTYESALILLKSTASFYKEKKPEHLENFLQFIIDNTFKYSRQEQKQMVEVLTKSTKNVQSPLALYIFAFYFYRSKKNKEKYKYFSELIKEEYAKNGRGDKHYFIYAEIGIETFIKNKKITDKVLKRWDKEIYSIYKNNF